MSPWRRIRDEVAGAWRSVGYDLGRRGEAPPVTGGPDVTSTGMNTFPGSLVDLPSSPRVSDARPPRRFVAVTAFCLVAALGAGGSYFAATSIFSPPSGVVPEAVPRAAGEQPLTAGAAEPGEAGMGEADNGGPATTGSAAAPGGTAPAAGSAGPAAPAAGGAGQARPAAGGAAGSAGDGTAGAGNAAAGSGGAGSGGAGSGGAKPGNAGRRPGGDPAAPATIRQPRPTGVAPESTRKPAEPCDCRTPPVPTPTAPSPTPPVTVSASPGKPSGNTDNSPAPTASTSVNPGPGGNAAGDEGHQRGDRRHQR